jgi:hypothetical protein
LFIAAQLGKRKLTDESDRLAWTAFRVWWLGLGLTTAFGALRTLMAFAGIDSLSVYVWHGLINTLILCAALWGLLFYLLYLYTGNRSWGVPLAGFYVVFFIALVIYSFAILQPQGVTLEAGTATVQYAVEASPAYQMAIVLIVLLPQILTSLAYFSIFFRLRERVQKYRVILVSVSVLVWFGSPLLALALSISEAPWWMMISRVIGLLAVFAIYWAYYPPQFIQRRFGVASI